MARGSKKRGAASKGEGPPKKKGRPKEDPDAVTDEKNESKNTKGLNWSKDERLKFLAGLRKYGKGKWKKIAVFVESR